MYFKEIIKFKFEITINNSMTKQKSKSRFAAYNKFYGLFSSPKFFVSSSGQNRLTYSTTRLLAIIGFLLISINIWGCFTPLQAAELMVDFSDEIKMTEAQLYAVTEQEVFDREAYLYQINDAVYQRIVHYWEDDGIDRYHLRVPISENYVLFTVSYLYPPLFEKYEYNNYKKAIERGIGLCSQHAIILTQLLNHKDIPAKIVGLDGHVVVTAQANSQSDQWWILDPDYGVVIEQDLRSIENDPQLISAYYTKAGFSETAISNLVSIFNENGNFVLTYEKYSPHMMAFEYLAYALKWVLPLVLIIPFLRTGNYLNSIFSRIKPSDKDRPH